MRSSVPHCATPFCATTQRRIAPLSAALRLVVLQHSAHSAASRRSAPFHAVPVAALCPQRSIVQRRAAPCRIARLCQQRSIVQLSAAPCRVAALCPQRSTVKRRVAPCRIAALCPQRSTLKRRVASCGIARLCPRAVTRRAAPHGVVSQVCAAAQHSIAMRHSASLPPHAAPC